MYKSILKLFISLYTSIYHIFNYPYTFPNGSFASTILAIYLNGLFSINLTWSSNASTSKRLGWEIIMSIPFICLQTSKPLNVYHSYASTVMCAGILWSFDTSGSSINDDHETGSPFSFQLVATLDLNDFSNASSISFFYGLLFHSFRYS